MTQSTDELDPLIGPPVEVNEKVLKACVAKNQFGPLTFDLYKEAASLVCVSSSVYTGNPISGVQFHRSQAICAGLLVRIYKFMGSIIKLTADTEYGEAVEALNRCVLESSIDLRFLLAKNDESMFDRFVTNALVAERELYDVIQENIGRRGGRILAVEADMMKSITEMCNCSGVNVEDVPRRRRAWGGSMRDKAKALNMDSGYVVLQMLPSHAIHGDWADLIRHHLLPNADGFAPNVDWTHTDGEYLCPTALLVMEAVQDYLDRYFDVGSAAPIYQRLESLRERLLRLEESRPGLEAVEE